MQEIARNCILFFVGDNQRRPITGETLQLIVFFSKCGTMSQQLAKTASELPKRFPTNATGCCAKKAEI